jgi:cytochrome c peroxidase
MNKNKVLFFVISSSMVVFLACKKDEEPAAPVYGTPYQLVIPQGLPPMDIPANNPMTEEGVFLGRKLFYDPILSGNNTQSCGSCHMAEFSFVDGTQFSLGSEGLPSLRNVMPIVNLGWQRNFFLGWRCTRFGKSSVSTY